MKFFDIFRDDEEPSFRELALEGHIQKALLRYANGKEEEMEAITIGLQAILQEDKPVFNR